VWKVAPYRLLNPNPNPELDEALDESLTPARIVGWISDTIWGGDASDEEDEVSVESSAVKGSLEGLVGLR
jgi:hypothetical protein